MDSEKKNYIIQVAEAIVAECERKIEADSKNTIIIKRDKEIQKKYKKLKYMASIIILIETVLCIVFVVK